MRNARQLLFGLGVAAVFFCGCSIFPTSLEQEYQFQERASFAVEAEDAFASGFAKDLCVLAADASFEDASINSEAAAMFADSKGEVLYAKNVFERLYPASITKVMTALLVFEDGNLDDMVTVPDEVNTITEAGATMCGIKAGDVISMRELLYGLLLPSGNDAAVAIAVHMDGSVEAFAERMNRKARELGATGTHFENPHGLNAENHYTTAYDLYLIFREVYRYTEFQEMIHTSSHTALYQDAEGDVMTATWKNSNWFLTGQKEAPSGVTVVGGKTGTTSAAGYCLILASKDEENQDYISVVLKAQSRASLYENMYHLVEKIVN